MLCSFQSIFMGLCLMLFEPHCNPVKQEGLIPFPSLCRCASCVPSHTLLSTGASVTWSPGLRLPSRLLTSHVHSICGGRVLQGHRVQDVAFGVSSGLGGHGRARPPRTRTSQESVTVWRPHRPAVPTGDESDFVLVVSKWGREQETN